MESLIYFSAFGYFTFHPSILLLLFTDFHATKASVDGALTKSDLNPDIYVFSSESLGNDSRLWPSIGNGHIATVIHSANVLMNGLYNGETVKSHRAAIPSPLRVNLTSFIPGRTFNSTHQLDTRIGVYEELVSNDACAVVLRWYAHRIVTPLLVFEVRINRTFNYSSLDSCQVFLNVSHFGSSRDILFTELPIKFVNARYMYGETFSPETSWSGNQTVHVIFDKIPDSLALSGGQKSTNWIFLASMHSNPQAATKAYITGKTSMKLYDWHVKGWLDLWSHGRIEIEGNLPIARAAAASLYNILTSLPEREDPLQSFIGLSPCGLSWGDEESYFGHIFWDQETWMYPPLLALHSNLGRLLLDTRVRTMAEAAKNANRTGYHGYRFPWESALTGVETSMSVFCAHQEIHVNGDISFAIMQYFWASGNIDIFIKEPFGRIILGIGDFWISRLHYNATRQLYDIIGVMPPDEYVINVNNSAFTNMVAIRSLESAASIALYLGLANHTIYSYYACHIYMPFDRKLRYHPEYDGYILGTTIKQADVILMGFPFLWEMSESVRLKDLEVYDKVVSLKGPAMSDSMYAIGWLEQKQYDKAVSSFQRMFSHIAGDFQVWTENKHGKGATNFITGMGGYLQALLFGFCGLRFRSGQMDIDPTLPPESTKMTITGLDYRGYSLNLIISNVTITVTLTSVPSEASGLWLRSGLVKQKLCVDEPVTIKMGKATLQESLYTDVVSKSSKHIYSDVQKFDQLHL